MMIIGIFCCACCATMFRGYQSRMTANRIFGNMTYLTSAPYMDGKVTLADGRYEWSYVTRDDFFLSYHLHYDGQYVYGDFNHDGLPDAAVILTENEGGSGEFRRLAFLINDGQHLVHQVSHYLGDRIVVNSIQEHQGKIILDMLVHGPHDCLAGPTKRVKNVYDYLHPNPDVVPMSQRRGNQG